MRVFFKFITIFIFLYSATSTSKAGEWGSPAKEVYVQNNGWLQYWVGEVVEVYRDNKGYPQRAKVSITHITDKSNYQCGQIVNLSLNDMKEVSGTSFQLHKC